MKQILLVEDDGLYSKILSYILENSGYIVECAGNGLEAITMLNKKKYDLIITDILMPQSNGLDLLNYIKTDKSCSQAKVLVLSVQSSEHYLAESFSRGADEYIKKPVIAKDFVQAVRRLV